MGIRNYSYLLNEYRKVWTNRQLLSHDIEDEAVLKEAIVRELLDENSHPRVRRSVYEKFSFATKRIINSPLANEDKIVLIEIHIEMMDEVNK